MIISQIAVLIGGWEVILSCVAFAWFIFWVWMLVDCIVNESFFMPKAIWFFIILFLSCLGAPVYYFVRKLPRGNTTKKHFYECVAEELRQQSLRPGLWAQAVAETSSEGQVARALYIRLRVAELMQIERTKHAQAQAEAQAQAASDARKMAEQRLAESRERVNQERQKMEHLEAERARIEIEKAASPYFGWIFFVGVIFLLVLVFLILNFFR